jgi:prepilin-type N-terminal cleavage/methylation domain-containing protein
MYRASVTNRTSGESGFTLIELLVVIAIILPGVLIPPITPNREPDCDEERRETLSLTGAIQATIVVPDSAEGRVRIAFIPNGLRGTSDAGGTYRVVGGDTTRAVPEEPVTVTFSLVGRSGEGEPVRHPLHVTVSVTVDEDEREASARIVRFEVEDPCD